MNIKKTFFLLAFMAVSVSTAFAQERFSDCSAAFLDNKIIVNEYTTTGHCEIAASATGELTVQTADLSPGNCVPTGKIGFKIAIRDGNTKTIISFSDKTYKQVEIQAVLSKCKPGDAIVLLTTADAYALPHNEILVK